MLTIFYVYVLLLENECYYVGITNDFKKRMFEHFRMTGGKGAKWTKRNKPIAVIHLSKLPYDTSWQEAKRIENECTLKIAMAKGFDRVRGGNYTMDDDEHPKKWNMDLIGKKCADFNKMTPLSHSDLQQIIYPGVEQEILYRKQREKIREYFS